MCGADKVKTSTQVQQFQYGSGEDAAMLSAVVKVYECTDCDLAWTDWEGEAARDAAVVAHLSFGC